ncbi:hypothetical protein [Candidatus Xianfuyuplasma coldseepsis]|uniref:Uncharacterized protein n=1 Tax=Candidatus Xianfuyuplasma coldseepsis TaxID=2782163 RepID=A0A7L7KRL0_9MOLU|nr:hypothetical protein [Xianfuyuplasma coldseepsis]QMS85373.1 hypothetical protein G4Z02_06275 [Xianfuyuplasma coldseepsis]
MEDIKNEYRRIIRYFQLLIVLVTITYFNIGLYYLSGSTANLLFRRFLLMSVMTKIYISGTLTALVIILTTMYFFSKVTKEKENSLFQDNLKIGYFISFYVLILLFLYQGYMVLMSVGECYPVFAFYLIPIILISFNALDHLCFNRIESFHERPLMLSSINLTFMFYFFYFFSYNVRFNNLVLQYIIILTFVGFVLYMVVVWIRFKLKKLDIVTIIILAYSTICYISLLMNYFNNVYITCT